MATGIDHQDSPVLPPWRLALLESPMRQFQILALAIVILLCALDGFDVFAITFAAPAIEREFAIGKAALGVAFSSGLIGMALGSLLLAPAADIYGRRRLVFVSLTLMVIGTLWTATVGSIGALALSRLLTGLGIGAMISTINPMAAEYANARRRDFAVSLLNIGYPLGGMIGGVTAAQMLPVLGWRAIFVTAAILAVVMGIIVATCLPEPIPGILARPGETGLARVNHYLAQCGQPPLATLPAPATGNRRSFALLLGRGEWANTLRITAIYFLFVLAVFFIQTWLPSLVAQMGYTPSSAAIVSTIMNLSGIVGGLTLSLLAPRLGLKPTVVLAMLLTVAAIVLFGMVTPSLGWLQAVAVLVGVSTIGGMTNLYAVVSRSFPAAARASGTGFVIGIGRFGSALGPALGGALLAMGFERGAVGWIMAVPAAGAALILLLTRVRSFG